MELNVSSAAAAAPPAGTRGNRWWKLAALGTVTLLLWLASITLPHAPPNNLDCWETILVLAHIQHWQFGPEIAFTYGPWGFLELNGYLPPALGIKFAWEIVGKLAMAATIVSVSGSIGGARRWVWLGAMICGAFFFDNAATVMLAMVTIAWLIPGETKWRHRAIAIGWLSFLAHFKFVFCLQAVVSVAAASVAHAVENRLKTAVGILGGFAAAYLAWWLAAGQQVSNLPEFWRLSSNISDGYSWAMGSEPAAAILVMGIAIAAMGLVFAFRVSASPAARRIAIALVVLATWFLAWKQGFTRADLHVVGFFVFALLFGLAVPDCTGKSGIRLSDLNVVLCLGAIALTGIDQLKLGPQNAWNRCKAYPSMAAHFPTWRRDFDASLAHEEKDANDEFLRHTVGQQPVDLLGYDQSMLFLNRLNYRPRPVIQSYSAYTPALLEANARFIAGSDAPTFIVVKLDTIDGRYPGQDDSLALQALVRGYTMIDVKPQYALVRRKSGREAAAAERLTPLAHHVPHYGDEMAVPDGEGHPVWMQIEFRPTWLGRLRALVYHATPPELIATGEDGQQHKFQMVTSTGGTGCFIQPLLESHSDLAQLMRGHASSWVRSVRLELPRERDHWFWRRPQVQFSALADIPLARADPLDRFVDSQAVNVRPVSIKAAALDAVALEDHALIFAHAPSEIVLPVADDIRTFSGGCGFMPGAYNHGQTDGADFRIDAVAANGANTTVWHRSLDPLNRKTDQGFQSFSVAIPAGSTHLRLVIDPGSRGNSDWDWTFWGDLRLAP